jgi:hypothetical protein
MAVGKTRLTVILALLCMAAACKEAHLDCANDQKFNDSLMAMYKDHSVTDSQDFGKRLVAAQDAQGKEVVRKALHGKSWAEANAYLDQITTKVAPPSTKDPAKG